TSGAAIPFELASGDLEWNAPTLVGGSWTHVFHAAGSYPYLCMRHLTEKGTVVVADGGADSATVQILAAGVTPNSVTIRPGGTVRWVNLSAANHALQTDRHCQTVRGLILHRASRTNLANYETRVLYPLGG